MGVLGDTDITLLQGDIEALRLEMERRITDLTTRVQRKVDCAPFYTLKAELDSVFNNMQRIINEHHIKLEALDKEVVKLQQQNESILYIISIYNKNIKAE
jgi:hypothetical protein